MTTKTKHTKLLQKLTRYFPYTCIIFTVAYYFSIHQSTNPSPTPNLKNYNLSCQIYNHQNLQIMKISLTNQLMQVQFVKRRYWSQDFYFSGNLREKDREFGGLSDEELVDIYGRLCSGVFDEGDQEVKFDDCEEYFQCKTKSLTVSGPSNKIHTISLKSQQISLRSIYYENQLPKLRNTINFQLDQNNQIFKQPYFGQQQYKSLWLNILYICIFVGGISIGMFLIYHVVYWYQHNGIHRTEYGSNNKVKIDSCVRHLFDTTDSKIEDFQFVNKIVRKNTVGDWSSLYLLTPAPQKPLTIKILTLTSWPISTGIIYTTRTPNNDTIQKHSDQSMIYSSDGTYFNGRQYTLANGSGFKVGDIVKIGMDLENRVVKWVLGGEIVYQVDLEDFGRENGEGEWLFVVQMRGKGDQFQLII